MSKKPPRSNKRQLQKQRAKARQQRQALNHASQRPRPNQESALQQAIRHVHQGSLPQAQSLLEMLTSEAPDFAAAWHCRGVVTHQQGDLSSAEAFLRQAIELDGNQATYFSNLSLVLLTANDLQGAHQAAEQALSLGCRTAEGFIQLGVQFLKSHHLEQTQSAFEIARQFEPQNAVVHNCLGIVLRLHSEADAAATAFRTAIELRPNFAEAHNNLGNVYRDAQEYRSAQSAYESALQYKPAFPEALNNLGTVLAELNELARAIPKYREALRLQPDYVEALNNLGNALRLEGELGEAKRLLQQALDRQPTLAALHNNIGNVYRDAGEIPPAIMAYRIAIEHRPDFSEACSNLATALVDQGSAQEAEHWYQEALRTNPQSPDTVRNLGNLYRLQHRIGDARQVWKRGNDPLLELQQAALCELVFEDESHIEDARRDRLATWGQLAKTQPNCDLACTSTHLVEPPFHLQFWHGNLRQLKQQYAAIFEQHFTSHQTRLSRPNVSTVGVVVTRKHEAIFLKSLSGVLNQLPHADFRLRVFAASSSVNTLRQGLTNSRIEVVGMPERFDLQAATIRQHPCDLLYYWEVGTDATNYFLPFLRLAPIQMTSWGVQVTSGIPNIDYYLSSAHIEPGEAADHYSESLLLADSILSYQEPVTPPSDADRSEFGLSEQDNLYLCAQQIGKFHPSFDEWLQRILQDDPHGRLVITGDKDGNIGDQLLNRWQRKWNGEDRRVTMLPHLDRAAYLRLVAVSDVCLDPPHFGGVNTTFDAFSLGKVVVTKPSEFHRGRYTAGCYRQLGLENLIAASDDEYVRQAVLIGTNEEARRTSAAAIVAAHDRLFRCSSAVTEHQRIFLQLIDSLDS